MTAHPIFDDEPAADVTINPLAGLAAWAFPGLGHIVRGERRRGRLIMLGLLFLILCGLLVGGVDCVDRERDRLWFLAQALCGPIAFAADFVNQAYVHGMPEPQRDFAIAINKPNEMGTLFVALAGLMNLVVMLDAVFAPRRGEFVDRRAGRDTPPPRPDLAGAIHPTDTDGAGGASAADADHPAEGADR